MKLILSEKIEKNAVLILIFFVAIVIIIATIVSISADAKQTAIRVNMNLIEEASGIKMVDTVLTQEIIDQSNNSGVNYPLIIGTATLKNMNITFGSSSTRYHGSGKYVLDIGFQGYIPKKDDVIRLSILVTDTNGDVIGNFEKDLIWR
jgi:hypothetical protein